MGAPSRSRPAEAQEEARATQGSPGGLDGTVAGNGGPAARGSLVDRSGIDSPGAGGRRRRHRRRGGQGSRGGGGRQDGSGVAGFSGKDSSSTSSFAAAPPAGL